MKQSLVPLLFSLAFLAACGGRPPFPGGYVITQLPRGAKPSRADALSVRYPPGSRIVLAEPPLDPARVRVLSGKLLAAGAPVVAPDGRRLVFAGQEQAGEPWQLFELILPDGQARQLTQMAEGAADPAILADGRVVFTSPVPPADRPWRRQPPPALHVVDGRTGDVERISFGAGGVADPSVLADGRILFVGLGPEADPAAPPRLGLFTVNADGTGLLPYGAQHQGSPSVRRPRETTDGRIVFVGGSEPGAEVEGRAEQIQSSHPFLSRGELVPLLPDPVRCLEPAADRRLLATLPFPAEDGDSGSYAIFAVGRKGGLPRQPLFDDPERDDVEVVPARARRRPRGHPSGVRPERSDGLLLCLDANATTLALPDSDKHPAARARVLGLAPGGGSRVLREVPVHEDGSFLATVPADRTLGLEVLDARGRVLRRLPPSIWIRPGEIRACPGCHAPHGRALPNRRPMALRATDVLQGPLPAASPHEVQK